MADVAGTPEATQGGSPAANPEPAKDDSGLNEQQKKEWMTLKQKAENYNKLEAELAIKNEQLARLAYAGQQATDPDVEAYKQALAQAEYDPVSRLAIAGFNKGVRAEAEAWLSNELDELGDDLTTSKRKQVAALIRANNYQLSGERALKLVTDPDTKTLSEQLEALRQENERLKNAKPNGASPASVVPATVSAEDGAPQNMKLSDYFAALQRASAEGATDEDKTRARALKQAAGNNKLKLERD